MASLSLRGADHSTGGIQATGAQQQKALGESRWIVAHNPNLAGYGRSFVRAELRRCGDRRSR
jgi:hypothetical protein